MICVNCKYRSLDGRCNRLVSTCTGRNDRVARDYMRGGECGFFEEGHTDRTIGNINFFNT